MAAAMQPSSCWGRLLIPGMDGAEDLVYSIEKPVTVIGRDQKCDIRVVNREVSRKHVQLEVDTASGCVMLTSLGREPVSVNSEPATAPVELFSGDQIEVHLEGRSRLLVFETDSDETLVLAPGGRRPFAEQDANNPRTGPITIGIGLGPKPSSRKRGKPVGDADPPPRKTPRSSARVPGGRAPPPPPPPPPPGALLKKGAAPAARAQAAKPAGSAAASRIDPVELQNALKAGIAGLKKARPAAAAAAKPKATPKGAKKAAFVPDSQELLKLRARLRKTSDGSGSSHGGGSGYCDFLGKGLSPAPAAPAAAAAAAARAPTPRSAAKTARRKSSLSSGSLATQSPAAGRSPAVAFPATVPPPAVAPPAAASPAAPSTRRSSLLRSGDVHPAAEQSNKTDTALETAAAAQAAAEDAQMADEGAPAAANTGEEEAVASGKRLRPAKKRKTVRFSLPLAVLSSPEGVPRDVTFDLNDATMQQASEIVHVDADNTMALSAWAMGATVGASPAAGGNGLGASPAPALQRRRSATGSPALPHIPEDRRRSSSRLRHSSGSDLPLAPIAEEHAAATPEAAAASHAKRRSLSSRPPTPAARNSMTPDAAGTARGSAGAPHLAAGTPASLLRSAVARQAGGQRSSGANTMRFVSPGGQPTPTNTPTTGQQGIAGAVPDAEGLASRLQEDAAAQGELTVELPVDFFASPQVDLTLCAAPEAQSSASLTPASTGGRGAAPTPQQPQPQVAVFRAVADGALPGAAATASPAGLTMRVPVAVLPSPDASAVTLRIPKEALEEAGRAANPEAAAQRLTLAMAEALGAVPADGSPAARLLQGVSAHAQKRIADATIAARLASTKAQKMAAAAAAADRRAAKLRRRNATLTKLLAREHGKRVEAEAALAAFAATITDASVPAEPAASAVEQQKGPVQAAVEEPVVEAPASASKSATEMAAPAPKVRRGRTPVQRERQIARIAAATAPTPVLPRWPFISPWPAAGGRRSRAAAAAAVEDVPRWLFCGEALPAEELAALAQAIDETTQDVADALGCAAEESADTEAEAAATKHATAGAAEAAAAADMDAEQPAQDLDAPTAEQQPRITVEVAQPALSPAETAQDATADALMDDVAPPPAPRDETAAIAASAQAAEAEEVEGEELCRVCGQDAGKKVMLLCDGCDAPTHLACTQPRLRRVPKGDWFCAACTTARTAPAAGLPAVAEKPAAAATPAAEEAVAPRGRKRAGPMPPPAKPEAAEPAAAEAAASAEASAPVGRSRGKRAAAVGSQAVDAAPAPPAKRTRRGASEEKEAEGPIAPPQRAPRKSVAPTTVAAIPARAARRSVAPAAAAAAALARATRRAAAAPAAPEPPARRTIARSTRSRK